MFLSLSHQGKKIKAHEIESQRCLTMSKSDNLAQISQEISSLYFRPIVSNVTTAMLRILCVPDNLQLRGFIVHKKKH